MRRSALLSYENCMTYSDITHKRLIDNVEKYEEWSEGNQKRRGSK